MSPAWGQSWGYAWGRSWGWSAIIDIHDSGDEPRRHRRARERLREQIESAMGGPAGAVALEELRPHITAEEGQQIKFRLAQEDVEKLIERMSARVRQVQEEDDEDAIMVLNG